MYDVSYEFVGLLIITDEKEIETDYSLGSVIPMAIELFWFLVFSQVLSAKGN